VVVLTVMTMHKLTIINANNPGLLVQTIMPIKTPVISARLDARPTDHYDLRTDHEDRLWNPALPVEIIAKRDRHEDVQNRRGNGQKHT